VIAAFASALRRNAMRTNHYKFPLPELAHPPGSGLERCCEVPSPSLSSRAATPVITGNGTGDGSLEFWRCRDTFKCGWVGQDPLSRNLRPEAHEFDPREIVYDLMCPRCKCSVVYVPLCCDCSKAAADLGSERCGACDARAEREEHEARMIAAQTRASKEMVDAFVSILTGGFRS
jgi:hypothetical protein